MDALMYSQFTRIARATEYPYTSKQGACREAQFSKAATSRGSNGWQHPKFSQNVVHFGSDYKPCTTPDCRVQAGFEVDMFQAVIDQGPFIVYVDASQWQRYKSGIFPPSACRSTMESGNHIVQLVGYGLDADTPYWLRQYEHHGSMRK